MTSNDRIDRLEALLERSITTSDERMTRIEQSMAASDQRMTRIEQSMDRQRQESNERLTRIEQIGESNNRFLEAFSADLRRYTDTMNNLGNRIDNLVSRIDGVIATSNQDRQETNTRLGAIQRQVSAIARHLGVT